MRAFVTGGTGFAGSHLIDRLVAAGEEVVALVHPSSSHQSLPVHGLVQAATGDLMNLPALKALVASARPDVIYHLAGQASPALSWENPAGTLHLNLEGTANILEAALAAGRPRVVVVTSADIYGQLSGESLPITEQTPPQPAHPYGLSKWAASHLARLYWNQYKLPVVEARPFNHIGPRQSLGFVVPDFASQLAQIKLGRCPARISVGNLAAQRDFTDVRDVVRAYHLLATLGRPGESYLVCSGQPVTIQYLLQALREIAGVEIAIDYDPARMRPSSVPCLFGSFAKLRHDTGWLPEIHLRQSLADALEEWVQRLQAEAV